MHLFTRASWLLPVASLALMGTIVDADGVLEVDLVFPRNDTYAPTQDFPVLFAFQNPELAPPLGAAVLYTVHNRDAPGTRSNDSIVDLHWEALRNPNWSGSDPHFVYSYFGDFFNREGRWLLTWEKMISNSSLHHIYFDTAHSGKRVDLIATTANTTCPEQLGVAINVTDKTMEVPSWVDGSGGATCLVVASSTPTPTPDPCRVKVDSAVTASMSASLLAQRCMGPNKPDNCPPEDDDSAAQQLMVSGLVCLAAALGAVGFLLA